MRKSAKSKKGALSGIMLFVILVGAILIGGGGLLAFQGGFVQQVIEDPEEAAEDESKDEITAFRTQNPSVNLDARVEDSIATGTNGLNASLVIKDENGAAITTHTINTADSSTTRDTFTDVIRAGGDVEIGIITTQNTINSNRLSFKRYAPSRALAEAAGLSSSQNTLLDPVKYDGETTKYSPLQCRAFDVIEDAFVANGTPESDTSKNFIRLDVTGVNFTSTTINSTKDIDASDSFVYKFQCKTVTADSQFGESSGLWIDHLDSDSTADDFEDVPSVTFKGVDVPESKGSAADQDKSANTAFDVFYNLGDAIKDKQLDIEVAVDPKSSEDPDFDMTLRLVGSGIAVKSGDTSSLIGRDSFVAYNTDTAKTQLATSTNNQMIVDITND